MDLNEWGSKNSLHKTCKNVGKSIISGKCFQFETITPIKEYPLLTQTPSLHHNGPIYYQIIVPNSFSGFCTLFVLQKSLLYHFIYYFPQVIDFVMLIFLRWEG